MEPAAAHEEDFGYECMEVRVEIEALAEGMDSHDCAGMSSGSAVWHADSIIVLET